MTTNYIFGWSEVKRARFSLQAKYVVKARNNNWWGIGRRRIRVDTIDQLEDSTYIVYITVDGSSNVRNLWSQVCTYM